MACRRAVCLFLFVISITEAQLVRNWNAVKSPHFEVVSRYDPAKIGPLVEELEWAREVFDANFGLKSKLDRPGLILIPDSPYEYEQMSPAKFSAGYFMGAPWRDLIVMRELAGGRRVLLHEYAHSIRRHQGGRVPAWFEEGFAEFWGSIARAKDGSVETGLPDPQRLALLRKGAWVPVSYLVTLDSGMKLDSADAVSRFYAQSWLYVHMLYLSPEYKGSLERLRAAFEKGQGSEQAIREIFSKTLTQFDNDARKWLAQERLPAMKLTAPRAAAAQMTNSTLEPVDFELAKLTISAAGPSRPQASQDYARLSKLAGSGCGRRAALGDLAFGAGLFREASEQYRGAIECGTAPVHLMQGLEASMSHRTEAPVKELQQLASLGGSDHSHYLLGRAHYFEKNPEAALKEFAQVSRLPAIEMFSMTRLTALAQLELKRFDEAEATARKLEGLVHDTEQRHDARMTLEDVRRARASSGAPQEEPHHAYLRTMSRVDGELVRVDCLARGARFWIREGAAQRKFLLANPAEVVTGPVNGTPLEFGCGAQRRKITLGFKPAQDASLGTEGTVRYIEFR